MSPTFRRLFAEGPRDRDLPFVEVDRYGNATLNLANHLSFPLANPSSREAVLSGLKFGSPVRLPSDLWQRPWNEPGMDGCDQLRIAVQLEPNEP